jgi:hypothetical protein
MWGKAKVLHPYNYGEKLRKLLAGVQAVRTTHNGDECK